MLLRALSIVGLVAAVCVGSLPKLPATAQAKASESHHDQLLSLFNEEWQYRPRTHPEFATMLGDKRYNDRLGDQSAAFFKSDLEQKQKFLAACEAIDPTGLSP